MPIKSNRAQEQEQWLHTLQSLSKKPIRVSKNCNGKPSQWIFLKNAVLPVDYRTVLHNEVVIDIDATRWKDVRLYAEMVQNTLDSKNIPYITAYTGGRGIHLHFFFSLSEDQKKMCEKSDVMPKNLRMWLFYHILQTTGISPKLIGPGNPFDTSVVNWSDEGKGHLIRIFGGKKRTYKTVLLEIPEERPNTGDITFPDDIELWTIPDNTFKEFMDNFRKSNKKRVEACKRYQKASQNFSGTYVNLPCVQKILEGVPEGQRNAGAHVLAIALRLDGLPQKEAQKVMLEYAGKCSKDNISESEYLGWVDWIFKEKPFWNCRFCKELGLCEEGCKFHEAAFKDVLDFLKDPDLIKKIDEILEKRIKKDRKNRMLVFFVCLSAYGSSPLNLFLKGESSIGKTHIAKSVAEYFPEEDVWFIGDMSPKALIHEHGEFRDGKVYVSLQNKILVFMETPRRETLEMLKPILSHDRTEIEYKIADKRASGQLGTKRVIICGWPATVFCTTDFKYLEELSTRSMLTTPEITEEKIAQVLKFKGSQYSRPWQNTEDEQERILKEALRALKSGINVCVPYADELAEGYEKSEPRVMRDFDKLMELIKMSAFLHQEQRVFIELDGTGGKYIIATEYDYWIGRLLFEGVKETTVTGIPQPVIDFYLNIIGKIEETITYRSIREKYVQVKRKPVSRTHVRNKFIEPLESIGWLSRDYDSVDKRVVVFEKCRIEPEIAETMGDYEASYFKDIFPEEKLKEYVGELEKIWNKKEIDDNILDCTNNGNRWFYTKKVPYFLEPNNEMKEGIKDEKVMKNENSTNPYNLGQTKLECEVENNQLIDRYDEETVLLQIPQDDTKIKDVIKKFKDSKKVIDTIGILKEKGKIMLGQGFIRVCRSKNLIDRYDEETVLQQILEEDISIQDFVTKFENQNKVVDTLYILEKKGKITASHGFMRKVKILEINSHGSTGPGLNTWTCGMCGKKFEARIPFEDYSGHAICEECWKKLTDS